MRAIKDIRELKIGDRIYVEKTDNDSALIGNLNFTKSFGTVIAISKNEYRVSALVQFDEYIEGHDGGGLGEDGHCWWIYPRYMKSYKFYFMNIYKRKHNFY